MNLFVINLKNGLVMTDINVIVTKKKLINSTYYYIHVSRKSVNSMFGMKFYID